jgi:hypothetical protein
VEDPGINKKISFKMHIRVQKKGFMTQNPWAEKGDMINCLSLSDQHRSN